MNENKLEAIIRYYLKESVKDWRLFLTNIKDNEVEVILNKDNEELKMFTIRKNIKNLSLIDIRNGLTKLSA
ncbi:hypothetical protein [Staphylococcus capitis]|uniref:hypothetical protein n=1 Tax=Staphylococcus capitis TaxID=29388 RepID=UPI000D1B5E20|nr:hypothetical protein [Staphylococcus capitis]PTH39459.1 hypothetical protein BU619_08140 [Staphylococcus capitis]HDG8789416.1 hypothetical protein [Staphylococcus aureus]